MFYIEINHRTATIHYFTSDKKILLKEFDIDEF
jgi:hypothetical protein